MTLVDIGYDRTKAALHAIELCFKNNNKFVTITDGLPYSKAEWLTNALDEMLGSGSSGILHL
jgi:hypothetical protein